jgi:chromatin remodeling complex protein RSC6
MPRVKKTVNKKSGENMAPKQNIQKVEFVEDVKIIDKELDDNEGIEGDIIEDTQKDDDTEEDNEEEDSGDISEETKKTIHTKDTVTDEFDQLINYIDTMIEKIRNGDINKSASGIKNLRSINKRLKSLKTHALKIAKKNITGPNNSKRSQNSGFLKKYKISDAMSEFTGFSEEVSRVDVTRFICKYVKDNNLQKPDDRRIILPDDKLKTILGLDDTILQKPFRYYNIQTYLRPHFHI